MLKLLLKVVNQEELTFAERQMKWWEGCDKEKGAKQERKRSFGKDWRLLEQARYDHLEDA